MLPCYLLFDSQFVLFLFDPLLLYVLQIISSNKLQMNALASEYVNEYFCEHCLNASRYYVRLLYMCSPQKLLQSLMHGRSIYWEPPIAQIENMGTISTSCFQSGIHSLFACEYCCLRFPYNGEDCKDRVRF